MTPPNPPPPTHHTSAAHYPSARLPPLLPLLPEEPAPAILGRDNGTAPPLTGTTTLGQSSGSFPSPAASGDALPVARAVEGPGSKEDRLRRSSRRGRQPSPAGIEVPGRLIQTSVSSSSGDLGPCGGHRREEESEGYSGIPSGSPSSGLPDNGGLSNSAGFRSESAQKVFEVMPVRESSSVSGINVSLEVGEVWERAPELVLSEGSSIRAIFTSPSTGPSPVPTSAGCAEKLPLSTLNAEKTQTSGVMQVHCGALDALMEGPRGGGIAPGGAGEAGGHLALSASVTAPGSQADFALFQGSAIAPRDGPGGSGSEGRQANTLISTSDSAGGERGGGRPCLGDVYGAQNRADCTQSVPDLAQLRRATDSPSKEGYVMGEEGGQGSGGAAYSGEANGATQQLLPAA